MGRITMTISMIRSIRVGVAGICVLFQSPEDK